MKIQGSEVKRYLKNVSVRYIYGKMLILTFEDSEEEILNHIVSYISTGTKAFQVVENARTELRFDGLEIDVAKRLVRKQKQEIDLTFTEFEILHLLARNPGRVFSVRRHIVVGANCILFSVYRPTRLCRIGTYRRF